MASHVCSKTYENGQGQPVPSGHQKKVFYAHHNVIFLIGFRGGGDEVIIPEILFGLLQLYNGKKGLRSSSGEGSRVGLVSCCNSRQQGSVPAFIPGWDDGKGIFCFQSPIDLLPGIFPAVGNILENISHHNSRSLLRLIPEPQDSCGAVRAEEDRISVINSGVHNTDERPASPKGQGGLGKSCQDAGAFHAGRVKKRVEFGNGWIGKTVQRQRQSFRKRHMVDGILTADNRKTALLCLSLRKSGGRRIEGQCSLRKGKIAYNKIRVIL